MSTVLQILNEAQQRAEQNQIAYAGLLTPQEAHALIEQHSELVLVDVRTRAELELVGQVPFAIHIEWAFYPGMVANPDFAKQLQATWTKPYRHFYVPHRWSQS